MDDTEIREQGDTATGGDGDAATAESPNSEPRTQSPELRTQNLPPDPELEQLRAELAAERVGRLESHRRALLAENAGRVVPELVVGESVESLEASVERARAAFEAVRSATLAELSSAGRVSAGNGQRGAAVDVEALSPIQKIAQGLRRD